MKTPGYRLVEEVARTAHSLVFRGIREADGLQVAVKTPAVSGGEETLLRRYRNEYRLLRELDLPGVPKALDLHVQGGELFLVMELFHGHSLENLIASGGLGPEEKLEIARSLAAVLAQVHGAGILHKDINPSNLFCDEKKGCLLADFGLAVRSRNQFPGLENPELMEGTPAYMAPEQSGRMNREVDRRSDLYSLGATLYHLFAGHTPFRAGDRLEMIYAHMAQTPPPLEGAAPEQVARIVERLMAKDPEERYQSAHGLEADLSRCLEELAVRGTVDRFPLGREDVSREFRVARKLYGRDEEIRALMERFGRVERGGKELFLVSGYSGIGKTSLIREIYKPVTRRRGFFISGKFDQYQREIPYAAFSDAFGQLMRQILSESRERLDRWKSRFMEALGQNGKVAADLIPGLEAVVGEQPPVPETGPLESRNRFESVFRALVRKVCDREHPLVLFLDDLQWIDVASLKLLESLMADDTLGHLMVIGAYRDNEVDPTHPLMIALDEMEKGGASPRAVALGPLEAKEVESLVADTLRKRGEEVSALSALVLEKTGGNPFFVNQFLKNLYDEGLLFFDEKEEGWRWNLEEIRSRQITDNVVELLVAQMNRLSPGERTMLRYAACLGGEFDPALLATVSGEAREEAARLLASVGAAGFLLVMGGAGKEEGESYRFPHDRIQQAAYSLMEEENRERVHLEIGRRLLAHWDRKRRPEEVFRIADQFNLGRPLLEGEEERRTVARLNLSAGSRAKRAAAFTAALEYLKEGETLVDDREWERDRPFAFRFYRELAECHYINGEFPRAETLFDLLGEKAENDVARAQVYDLRLTLYVNRGKLKEALEVGNRALAMFGQAFPETAEALEGAKKAEFARIKERLAGVADPMELADRPAMEDPGMEAVMELLMNLGIPAFIAKKELFPVVGLRMVDLSLEHGNCKVSAYGYGFYGMILGAVLDDYAGGYAFGRLALKLHDRFDNRNLTCKLYRIYGAYIDSWTRPYKEGIDHLRHAYQAGVESGDMVYAGYCLNHIFIRRFLIADTLDEVEKETEKGLLFFRRNRDHILEELQRMMLGIVRAFRGKTRSPVELTGDGFDEEKSLAEWEASSYGTLLAYYFIYKLQLFCVYGRYEEALAASEKAEAYLGNMVGNVLKVEWVFYTALALLASGDDGERLRGMMEQMERWARYNPVNFGHKRTLLTAALARSRGNHWEAMEGFYRAGEEAKAARILLDEALANEWAARHLYEQGMNGPGEGFALRACKLYRFWGALPKAEGLRSQFPLLAAGQLESRASSPGEGSMMETVRERGLLDVESVIKNAMHLSSTLVYPKLVEHLLETAMENAGAQKGAVATVREGELFLEAEKEEGRPARVMLSARLEEGDLQLPMSVVRYVSRSGEPVILEDAAGAGNGFASDPYVQAHGVRSLLALPILFQGKTSAVLYLENRSAAGVFTVGRLQVLNIFASQAAISLENARLYRNLEQRVEEEVEKREKQERIVIQQSKLAAMGEMMGNIAHQWRQPLNALSVLIQDVREAYEFGELDQAYLDRNVERSKELIRRMSETINDFRDFFRPDKEREPFDAARAVDDAVAIIGSSLQHKNIELEISGERPLMVEGYKNEYGQVILNLLSNAKEALEQAEGERKIRVTLARTGEGKSLVSVEDTGGGIREEIMEKVFEPYFTTKFKSEGTGIGLYMSKMIVERNMAGRIRVENRTGSDGRLFGAVFSVEV